MKYGIIYPTVNFILNSLKYLNLVESLKWIFRRFMNDNDEADRIGADLFILLKWGLVILLWQWEVKSSIINILLLYLIATNLYTYFYYHIWDEKENPTTITKDEIFQRRKRRFIHLLQAVGFNILTFAYLIAMPFSSNFKWEKGYSNFEDSVFFSLSQTLTIDYSPVESINRCASQLITIETFVSFIFLTIVLSTSVPEKEL
jgi:hypothetical protein